MGNIFCFVWFMPKSSFVAAIQLGHPVFDSSDTILPFHRLHFHYAGLQWVSTIQHVFKTQIRREVGKWGDLCIDKQSCSFFKVFQFRIFFFFFLMCKCLTWSMMNILALKASHPAKASCHADMTFLVFSWKGQKMGTLSSWQERALNSQWNRTSHSAPCQAASTSCCNGSFWGDAGWHRSYTLLKFLCNIV